ncbi:MAG: glutamyl-tRNA amidotransferase [Bacteroidetes bacterium GWA2_30_7]|nr:MAG: glutamyl-tRNA amidotransferase [Bacteroidetes bacterium GWA2_30_7]
MSLVDKINDDIKKAMLAKEKEKLEAIRAVKAALIIAKTEKGSVEITPEKEIQLLNKLVKQRKESAEIYMNNNRKEMAEKELFEASIIEAYLPAQMSENDLTAEIKKIIAEVGAKLPSDMGKVMGKASKQFAGKADNKLISEIVKRLLSN